MRIWDQIPCKNLCDKHLLGEHRELHAIWNILQNNKKGYRNHPEVKRWKDCMESLAIRHMQEADEMIQRGFKHKSHLDGLSRGQVLVYQNGSMLFLEQDAIYYMGESPRKPEPWDDQKKALIKKNCGCILNLNALEILNEGVVK